MFLMPSSDPTFGRRDLAAVRKAAYRDDWAKLTQALSADVADGDDRSYRVTVAVKTLALRSRRQRTRVAQWATAEPANATAALLHGALEVDRAWDVRGGALAKNTRRSRLTGFMEILDRAEHWFRTAAKLDPTDPTPWQWLLYIARGQQVPPAETLARHDGLVAVSPEHFMGHFMAVGSLSPMWGYSREFMYRQVQNWTSTAPAGSLLHALIFVAHMERWRRGRVVRDDFLGDPDVRAEAEAATERMRMEPCRQPAEFWAHNYAAGWYSTIKDRKRARAHFELLGNRRTPWPWEDLSRLPDPTFRNRRLVARYFS